MTPLDCSERLLNEATRLLADIANGDSARSFLITGCMGGEGATTLAIALTRAAGKGGSTKALLVDADLMFPRLSRLANADGKDGLRQLVNDPGSYSRSVIVVSDDVSLLPAGRADGTGIAELVTSGALDVLLAAILHDYNFVFLDTHALVTSPDTGILMSVVPNVILVTQSDSTRMDHFTICLNEIANAQARTVAVMRNRVGRLPFSASA